MTTWPHPRRWSLARQLLALQVVVVVLVVGVGVAAAYVGARSAAREDAARRTLGVARSVADAPDVVRAARSADPPAVLQPYAERVRRDTGTDFVVVMAPDRTRWSHPNPALVGRPFIGTIGPALAGGTVTETYTGTLGPSVRSVVPVLDGGRVVALVAVGITVDRVGRDLRGQIPAILLAGAAAVALAAAGAWLVSRRLRRQTRGLAPDALGRMLDYYDAVLHAVREGLVIVGTDGVVRMVNDEGLRLLGLPAGEGGGRRVQGRRVDRLGLAPGLAAAIAGTGSDAAEPVSDELHLTGERVLVVSRAPARWEGVHLGTVVTLRDHTELAGLSGELDSVRGFAEALRSQAHEASNRLHTVVSLIELGRPEDALEFATHELAVAQELTDRLVGAVAEPVLVALLLGKATEAAERGVELVVTDDTDLPATRVEPRDLVTLVGNLVDNAVDAALVAPPPRRVDVTVRVAADELVVRVADTGAGLEPAGVAAAFRRGWSTKPEGPLAGRGLGLALVGQTVHRYGGTIDVGRAVGAVFTVRIPERAAEAPAPAEHGAGVPS